MSAHTAGGTFIALLSIALVAFAVYFFFVFLRRQLGRLGLTGAEVSLILWATLIGAFVNIPLYRFGGGSLGVNVGGGLLPLLLSFYLIRRKKLPFNEVFVGVVVVAAISYLVTDYRPGEGVVAVFPLWLLPALGAFFISAFAYWHDRSDAAGLAYVVGTLGVLLGADIARLPEILAGPRPESGILSIGGGAAFDMVYLTGVLAVAMEAGIATKTRFDLSRSGRENPIEREYQEWVRKKQAQDEPRAARSQAAAREPRPSRAAQTPAGTPAPQWRAVERRGR